jgi:hypothetical protein
MSSDFPWPPQIVVAVCVNIMRIIFMCIENYRYYIENVLVIPCTNLVVQHRNPSDHIDQLIQSWVTYGLRRTNVGQ